MKNIDKYVKSGPQTEITPLVLKHAKKYQGYGN